MAADVVAIGAMAVMVAKLLVLAQSDGGRRDAEVAALYGAFAFLAAVVLVPLAFVALAGMISLLMANRSGFVVNVVFGALVAIPALVAIGAGWWWSAVAPLATLGAGIYGMTTDELRE